MHLELLENAVDVVPDRGVADPQRAPDFLVRHSFSYQSKDLLLALRQRGLRHRFVRLRGQRCDPAEQKTGNARRAIELSSQRIFNGSHQILFRTVGAHIPGDASLGAGEYEVVDLTHGEGDNLDRW